MKEIVFTWDDGKAAQNLKKHGVYFEEARTVFVDEHARLIYDPDHSSTEERFILLGMSIRFRVLVVSHCYRKKDAVIRIISARKANRSEQEQYKENLP